MRRRLLTLLALLVLLMQPAALLHGLSHGHGGNPATATSANATTAAYTGLDEASGDRNGLDCLQCLAFAVIGGAVLPAALLLFRTPLLRHATPEAARRLPRGGTGAGYHARGPPTLA
jgi:hypothetical protein